MSQNQQSKCAEPGSLGSTCPNCERLTKELKDAKRAYLEWTDEDEALAGIRENERLRAMVRELGGDPDGKQT